MVSVISTSMCTRSRTYPWPRRNNSVVQGFARVASRHLTWFSLETPGKTLSPSPFWNTLRPQTPLSRPGSRDSEISPWFGSLRWGLTYSRAAKESRDTARTEQGVSNNLLGTKPKGVVLGWSERALWCRPDIAPYMYYAYKVRRVRRGREPLLYFVLYRVCKITSIPRFMFLYYVCVYEVRT
jgi:hypothetical protein